MGVQWFIFREVILGAVSLLLDKPSPAFFPFVFFVTFPSVKYVAWQDYLQSISTSCTNPIKFNRCEDVLWSTTSIGKPCPRDSAMTLKLRDSNVMKLTMANVWGWFRNLRCRLGFTLPRNLIQHAFPPPENESHLCFETRTETSLYHFIVHTSLMISDLDKMMFSSFSLPRLSSDPCFNSVSAASVKEPESQGLKLQPELKLDGEWNYWFYLHLNVSDTHGLIINSVLSIPAAGDRSVH